MEALDKHKEYCNQHAIARVVMPKPKTVLTFRNHEKSMPIVVYMVLETPSSFSYYIQCFDDKLDPSKLVKFTLISKLI